MSKYKTEILVGIIVLIGMLFAYCIYSTEHYKDLYNKELQNVEAYKTSNSELKEVARQYKYTIDELYDSQDSLDQKLLQTMQQLKIKEKKVKELQYQLKQATRTDTLFITDTIFKENVSIDTTLGDDWYNLNIKLQYPSTIITTPTFNSEQYVYIYNTKAYNSTPSKIFFIRWFQKKHVVTEVKIEEKNPYINIIQQKFIEINK